MDRSHRNNSQGEATKPLVHVTPDQGWAWVISIACAFINGITFGLIRAYGVLFFTILEHFHVSRETASWPFCLCTSFTHLSGPIAGLLLSTFSLRVIVFTGSFLAAVGISLCFFASSILEITIYIGILQGFGIGLSFMQTPVILAQYFEKYRATATAISYAGGTIGSFIFPPILEYILGEYGLNGCFLIIGGIMLNSLPFALLLRPATPGHKVDKLLKEVHRQFSVITDSKRERLSALSELKQQSMTLSKINQKSNRNKMHLLIVGHMCNCDQWLTHQMIIVDFSIDRGMSNSQAVILLSSFAVADLFGRLASGLLADKRLVRKRNIVSICILMIGVLIFMTPAAKSFRILLVLTIALGFVSGSIIVLFSILTMEYVGLRRLPIALSTSALVVGVTSLFRPILIGYFRDTFQSYDGLFHSVGFFALLTALLWLSEPFARLWVTRRKKYGYGFKISVI